jgi:glucosamine-6-phosphate deaminase
LATGSTPIGIYRELIRMHRDEGLSFKNVVTFNLDEYYPMPKESIHSYHRFMWENLFSQIDIDPANVISLRRTAAAGDRAGGREYEQDIVRAGGIDFQILGIGKTGHIGFKEPGSGADSRTRLVTLDAGHAQGRRRRLLRRGVRSARAVTMGIATILDAREIAIIATGEHKASIVQRAVEGEIDVESRRRFSNGTAHHVLYLDRAAAAELTRIKTPWLIDEVQWTQDLILRAVIWLSERTGKAILKLTQRDYADARMSSLVAKFGSPGEVKARSSISSAPRSVGNRSCRSADVSSSSRRTRMTTSSRWAASCASWSRTTTTSSSRT